MAIGKYIPFWVALIVNILIIVFATTGCIAANTVRDEIERQNAKYEKKVNRIRNLQSLASSLESQCSDAGLKKIFSKLAE